VLIVTEKGSNLIDTYTVGRNGVASAPTVIASNGGGPYGFAFAPNGNLILTEAGTATLSSYAVTAAGSLSDSQRRDTGLRARAVLDRGVARWKVRIHEQRARRDHLRLLDLGYRDALPLQLDRCKTAIPTLDMTFTGTATSCTC